MMRVLDTTLPFYRNVSTKHCIAKWPEICSLLNNWSVCSSSLSLIKRTFCSTLTSAKTSSRELGKKKKKKQPLKCGLILQVSKPDLLETLPLQKMVSFLQARKPRGSCLLKVTTGAGTAFSKSSKELGNRFLVSTLAVSRFSWLRWILKHIFFKETPSNSVTRQALTLETSMFY